jgi:uncharacterized protein YbjQ (UPF0145 family)
MTTTPGVPGREIEHALALVSGSCVMSRNTFSDIQRVEEAARALDADAIVGIDLTVQTVADKAQLVMLMGTAVILGRSTDSRSECR